MRTLRSRLWPLAGIVFIVIAVPFILQLVPPNRVSGFRVDRTLSDERIWFEANRVMGYALLAAGAVILATTLVTARRLRGRETRANKINLLVFVVSLLAALAYSFWALGRM